MTRAFWKDVFKSVASSAGRFVAIALIAALGAGFYAGLRMTGLDMRLAADEFYDGTNLSDLRVVCALGLSDENVRQIAQTEGVSAVMPAYEADATAEIGAGRYTVRVHSLDVDAAKGSDVSDGQTAVSDDESYMNRPILTSGRWPEASNECIVSADAVLEDFVAVGDVITLVESIDEMDGIFSQTEFTVVGAAKLPYYACLSSMGTSSLGAGTVEQVLYVPEGAFADDYPYTEAFVTVAGARALHGSSEEYDACVGAVRDRLDAVAEQIAASRLAEVKSDAQGELDRARSDFEAEEADAYAQLDDAKAQLDSAASTLASSAAQIEQSERQLASGQISYEEGVSQLAAEKESAVQRLDAAAAELDSGRASYDSAMAQRAQLAAQLEEVNAGIAAIDAQVPDIPGAIAQAEAAVAALNAQMAALDPAAEGYEAQLAALEGQKAATQAQLATLQGLSSQRAQALAGAEQLTAGIAAIDAQTAGKAEELAAGEAQLAEQRAQAEQLFAEGESRLAAAAAQLQSGRSQLESGKRQHAQGLSEYQDGQAEYEEQRADALSQLDDARAQLDEAQADIDALDIPECYVLDRSKAVGAESYESDSQRIDRIAEVFPFLFFLVAALVSLTTMTRMVDEERILIGTYKALGYSKGAITSKYLLYALAASGAGSVVGIVALSKFLPWFIMNAYGIIYIVPQRPVPIDPALAALSFAMSVGVTVGATWLAAASTLRERPAALMLPRAPKAGKRILLERVRPLWSRMSFSWKVTSRNIFRYKQRFIMAVVGIAGCTALLLTGLGLQDSINDIIDKQFGEIYHYDYTVHLSEGADASAVEGVMDASQATEGYVRVCVEGDIARAPGQDKDNRVELVVPEDADALRQFVELRERTTGQRVELPDEGAVISEKLATNLGLSVGDDVVVYAQDDVGNASGEGVRVRVAAFMENYVNQFIFMTPAAYEAAFGKAPAFDAYYLSTGGDSGQAQLLDALSASGGVETVAHNEDVVETYRGMLKSVDAVVVVLIVAAALLAFVVLYNLTNINITERVREIATLKVLGFTPGEVNAYIFRETVILSLIGGLVGLVLGIGMESFVVTTAEVDQVMFGRDIHASSFAAAFVLTMAFTVVVMLAMRRKLARIDMVESLKSNE